MFFSIRSIDPSAIRYRSRFNSRDVTEDHNQSGASDITAATGPWSPSLTEDGAEETTLTTRAHQQSGRASLTSKNDLSAYQKASRVFAFLQGAQRRDYHEVLALREACMRLAEGSGCNIRELEPSSDWDSKEWKDDLKSWRDEIMMRMVHWQRLEQQSVKLSASDARSLSRDLITLKDRHPKLAAKCDRVLTSLSRFTSDQETESEPYDSSVRGFCKRRGPCRAAKRTVLHGIKRPEVRWNDKLRSAVYTLRYGRYPDDETRLKRLSDVI